MILKSIADDRMHRGQTESDLIKNHQAGWHWQAKWIECPLCRADQERR